MTTISAKVVRDSISPDGIRLTTIEARYPRFIHAEVMTHRVFSRNARSSRAVPVERMIKEIEENPVVPLFWGKNQKGMQASEECDEPLVVSSFDTDRIWHDFRDTREGGWLRARDQAVMMAKAFSQAGYHKQVVNRLLEPFMHIDVLISATEWDNFFELRDHPDAEPHIQVLAREIKAAMGKEDPDRLTYGEWHLPYVSWAEELDLGTADAKKVSAARCARISYAPFDGNSSIEAELARFDLLVGSRPIHASPVEHQATPTKVLQTCNFRGWHQFRKVIEHGHQ